MGVCRRYGWLMIPCKSRCQSYVFNNILIRPNSEDRLVALKICTSSGSEADEEISVREKLGPDARSMFVELLDCFKHEGPNGAHDCLVLELMACSAQALFYPRGQQRQGRERLPVPAAKKAIKTMLLGIEALHARRLVQSDAHPGNLLIKPNKPVPMDLERLARVKGERVVEVKRPDGKIDMWAPKRHRTDSPLFEYVDLDADMDFKVSDLGNGKTALERKLFTLTRKKLSPSTASHHMVRTRQSR